MTGPPSANELSLAPEIVVVAMARNGDQVAFAELVRRRQSFVRNFLRRLCRDAMLSDDLSQQVFLRAWRTIGSLREPHAYGKWLRTIAINCWLQHQRRSGLRLDSDASFDERAAVVEAHAERIDLDAALSQLPAAVRLCVVLAYHDGMSHREIADATALPVGTVKSHIHRGSARLRALLGSE
jgi:RNA polymerase sigma-70 factor, ECF subfamily